MLSTMVFSAIESPIATATPAEPPTAPATDAAPTLATMLEVSWARMVSPPDVMFVLLPLPWT